MSEWHAAHEDPVRIMQLGIDKGVTQHNAKQMVEVVAGRTGGTVGLVKLHGVELGNWARIKRKRTSNNILTGGSIPVVRTKPQVDVK